MKFRWKLFMSYALLALLMAGALYLQVNRVLEGRLVEESRQHLLNEAKLARMTYEQLSSTEPPQKIAEQLGSATRSRVTVIAPDGMVMADSDIRSDRVGALENHAGRSEVRQALATGSGSSVRYSDTLRVNMMYVAVSGSRAGAPVLRLSLPLEYLDSAKRSVQAVIGASVAVLLAVAVAISAILSNLTSRPLRAIAEAASRFGAGERGVRMPVQGRDEIGYLAGVLNQMAERLEDQIDGMARERQRLDAILHGMGEGVMVLDPLGIITLVNPAFRLQLEIAGDVIGKSLVEACRHPDLLQAYEEHRLTGGEVVGEVSLGAGKTILSTHWMPLGDRQGTVAVFHDISELKRTEAIRRDFVANLSHELRTPVSVIKGYAETLLDGAIDDVPNRGRHFVSIIAAHSERLTNLINDILTLSRLEAREAALDLQHMDVSSLLRKSAFMIEELAKGKGVELSVICPEQLPRIMADQGQLEQVLQNLLENAIKYTPQGGRVTVDAIETDGLVQMSVSDTGIGIPHKDIPRIFERFYRVDEARSREQGGTGLGLAIVKHIVQLHEGKIDLVSEVGRGSRFTVSMKAA